MNKLHSSPIRILLADDHSVVRAGIRQFLEQSEEMHVIAEAADGEEAKGLISEHLPDVAVLDIQMPKATGIEVTRWVRENHKDIGILILTAFDETPYISAVIQSGANGYVLKTATPQEVIQAVHNVHEGKSAIDQLIIQKMMTQMDPAFDFHQKDKPTKREMEVLQAVAKGFTNKAIGIQLNISDRTVQGHLANIFNKLQASSRTEAVMRAVSFGWLSTDLK
ncbi:MAG: response regulator transcription factor [Chloroflexi bacterium]|jgi:DNA-binding NarL/FixJ family response regulator|nr:response regulator transcription factor [Chloroflexota bacterium]MBT3669782.1 response regulator transcription factor [Chloroflexota bacterium]MBT4002261.1 response regulator transcription factor [Chloroflexota bacterium]MBT4305262.1 response regulator transcription factor [Chloroflexota bacterium]MBT4534815.1 response regulator transcription factor [Chloroflexota bacterium]